MYKQKYIKYKKKYLNIKHIIQKNFIGGGDFKSQNDIQSKINELKLLRRNDEILKELLSSNDKRKLNFIAFYIINKPSEVLSRAIVYNCFSQAPIHECTYYTHCVLEIINIEEIENLKKRNKICLDSLNRCLINKSNDFILPVQCSRRTLEDESPHFFLTLIEKKNSKIYISIKEPYFEESKRFDFSIGDEKLLIMLKNLPFLKDKDIIVLDSNRNICKMPQAITNDLSCQIWSIIYEYIYLCSSIESNDIQLEQFLNINPFYFMMMFLTNIYHFYKYEYWKIDKRKDISISQSELTYDYTKLNKHSYFNLRRQFLHLVENCSEEICNYYMNIIITNGQKNLVHLILHHKFKPEDTDKYISTISELNKYILQFGNSEKFRNSINLYINELKQLIEQNINYRQSNKSDITENIKKELDKELNIRNKKINILSEYN